jgi:polyisoprenoid-binding protein YceI
VSGARVFGSDDVDVHVFTYKEGALSALAHDLKLRVTRFRIGVDDDRAPTTVTATFDASSLRVVSAMRDGHESALLPAIAFGEVERNIEREVLRSRTFPEITFVSSAITDAHVDGALTLCGVTRDVRIARTGTTGRVRIDQREFGIKPFSAMMGTLKIKPHVDVVLARRASP